MTGYTDHLLSESRGGGALLRPETLWMIILHTLTNANMHVLRTDKCNICGLHDCVAIGPILEGRRNVDISQ